SAGHPELLVSRIDRLHLRIGVVVRIDSLDPPGAGVPRLSVPGVWRTTRWAALATAAPGTLLRPRSSSFSRRAAAGSGPRPRSARARCGPPPRAAPRRRTAARGTGRSVRMARTDTG